MVNRDGPMITGPFFHLQAILILCLMAIGISFRRRRALHIKIMALSMAWDVLLILQIELTRGAIVKVATPLRNSLLLNLHIILAVLCVLGYITLVVTGRKVLKNHSFRTLHGRLGLSVFVMRILVFVTSFWAVSPIS